MILMHNAKRSCLIALVALLLGVVLTGCMEGKFHVSVNADGSADFDYKIGFDRSITGLIALSGEDLMMQISKGAEAKGYEVTLYNEGTVTGMKLTRHLSKLNEANLDFDLFDFGKSIDEFVAASSDNASEDPILILKEGLFFTSYKLDGKVDLRSLNIGESNQLALFGQSLMKNIDLSFVLTLPIKPGKHNATVVSDDGHTMEWKLTPGEVNSITMEGKVPKIKQILYFATILLIASVIGIVYYRYTKKKVNIIQ